MTLEMITTEPDYLKRVRTHLDWSKLEQGDIVAHVTGDSSYFGLSVVMYTVARVTPTLIIMEDTSRWYRKDGRRQGHSGGNELRHPQDDGVITVQQRTEFRSFKRAMEKMRASFQSRITILEGNRRKPDALPGV